MERTTNNLLSTAAIYLLAVFLFAIIIALAITVLSVSPEARALALAAVTPFIVLDLVFVRYCKQGRAWSFVGASILGAAGAGLRLAISTQPGLEVGGGLPLPVTLFYLALAIALCLTSMAAAIGLRKRR